MTNRPLPTLFISHGAPTYAFEPGVAGAQLTALGLALPKPEAVLVISPHWMTRGLQVAGTSQPQTMHDFGGFAPALSRIQYQAPGAPTWARRTAAVLQAAGYGCEVDFQRGLDHGAWVPLRFLYPNADVPVYQMSMPHALDGLSALALGASLACLADEGVLIIGSGSLTHNLHEFQMDAVDRATDQADPSCTSYVPAFVGWVREQVERGDHATLARALELAPHAARAHPTPDHFLPLLVAAGAANHRVPVTVLDGGVTHRVLAMESYVFGAALQLPRYPSGA